jgi:hypothetical protein
VARKTKYMLGLLRKVKTTVVEVVACSAALLKQMQMVAVPVVARVVKPARDERRTVMKVLKGEAANFLATEAYSYFERSRDLL